MGDFVVPEWMETTADREARLERERLAEQRLIQAQRQLHIEAIRVVGELVEELFVDKVHQIVYFKEMGIRSRKAAVEFAEAAVKHHFKDGHAVNTEQDTKGGIMLHKWSADMVPRTEDMAKLELERKTHGSWVDRARKNVVHKFQSGQTKVVKQPRIIKTITTYAGKGDGKGPRETDGLGPSWAELYVGQRVAFTEEAVKRREIYGIKDAAGVWQKREKGDTIYKALLECTGVIIDAVEDMQLQTNVTYAPGTKITNYVCYPGGGSYVRWDLSGEITLNWTDRLVLLEDGNSIEDVERRTNYIEEKDWAALDAEMGEMRQKLNQLPEKFVLILRDKAMAARIRAHRNKIERFSKEAIAKRMGSQDGETTA